MDKELRLRLKGTASDRETAPGAPFWYEVNGMPEGLVAQVGNLTGRFWQIRFGPQGAPSNWTGRYNTAEEALHSLKRALELP